MSTDTFYNNINRTECILWLPVNKIWFPDNPTWRLTVVDIGRGAKNYTGVLKAEDSDGSFIGGANNYGGTNEHSGGLLAITMLMQNCTYVNDGLILTL